ncbi:glycosyltransferase [Acidithiobacillus sp. AC3]
MREWGHKWLVDEEELTRLASWAGLEQPQRVKINESTDPHLSGLETRLESTLIMEFARPVDAIDEKPLVSIVIPAFRADFLAACLDSALAQTYPHTEVLVLDDCPTDAVAKVCENYIKQEPRLTYRRNAESLSEGVNLTEGIRLVARGTFIKPLYDDDLLAPEAVERLVEAWRAHPGVRLAAVRRLPIDAAGQLLDETLLPPLSLVTGRLRGTEVIGHLLVHGNLLGEPTCMMFRRSDALAIDEPHVMNLFGRSCVGAGDVCFAMHLLSRGDLAYVAEPLARLRIHPGQSQRQQSIQELALGTWSYLRQQGTRLGFVLRPQPLSPVNCLGSEGSSNNSLFSKYFQSWASESRWLPLEVRWAEEVSQAQKASGQPSPHIALALLLHPSRSAQATIVSVETQWERAELLELPPASENWLAGVNDKLLASRAEWIALLDAGDELAPDAIFRIQQAITTHPEWQLLYTDEDSLTADGQHTNPHCKPDFNIDYLRSLPYVGGLLVIRKEIFEALGGFDPAADGAEDYDLVLRAWERVGDAGIGHIPAVLYHRLQGGGHCNQSIEEILAASKTALERHLQRLQIAAEVLPGPFPPSTRVRYPLTATPTVSIIIPTRNQLGILQRCVESIIEKTRYPHYEILLVDNDSDDEETRNYLQLLEAQEESLGGRLRVLRHPGAFNFSAMNNRAVEQARGDYLLLLNNDTAALHEDWLDEMVSQALRPEVGIVGAKLLFPDGKIQHAGVILGMKGPAEHAFIGQAAEYRGYYGRAMLTQDLSAVTGACLLLSKELYQQAGGLDDEKFQVSYNDIDLCLKVRELGKKIVFTPWAILMHEGSASQRGEVEKKPSPEKEKRFAGEKMAFYRKWLPQIAADPAYNLQLSLASTDFLIESEAALTWDPGWRPRPRILVHPADREGCGEYRIIAPMRALNRAGRTQGWETMRIFEPAEMERMQPDSIVLQRQMEWPQIEALERHKALSGAFRVFEIDDLITNLPVKSLHKAHIHKDIAKRFRKAAGLCNRLVVATEPLAQAYKGFSDEVRVQPNCIEDAVWGSLQAQRRGNDKPRVGWAGGVGHTGDLEMVADVVRDLAEEVDWIFFGLCPDALKPYVREFHTGVPLPQYPAKLASLDLDLAIAPLEDNPFNEAKSHLRLLEYGILGYPVVCSDVYPYQGDFPVVRVSNRYRDWVRAIREAVADRQALAEMGDRLREQVRAHWLLENRLDDWLAAWLP